MTYNLTEMEQDNYVGTGPGLVLPHNPNKLGATLKPKQSAKLAVECDSQT